MRNTYWSQSHPSTSLGAGKVTRSPEKHWCRGDVVTWCPLARMILLVSLLLTTALAGSASAATYWVSPAGTASWLSSRSDADPGTNYCSLSTANTNAQAGDIVYLKGGIYNYANIYDSAIAPLNSGSPGNLIIFRSAPGETAELKGAYGTRMWGLFIDGNSYIQIDGIIFSDFSDYIIRNGATHIEVENSTFRNVTSPYRGGGLQIVEESSGGNNYNCYVSDIWI